MIGQFRCGFVENERFFNVLGTRLSTPSVIIQLVQNLKKKIVSNQLYYDIGVSNRISSTLEIYRGEDIGLSCDGYTKMYLYISFLLSLLWYY